MPQRCVRLPQRAADEGADIIDVGAMSTAPYLQTEVPVTEEVRRMTWALEVVGAAVALPLSADTTRAAVASAALSAGARIINDVSGLRADERMAEVATRAEDWCSPRQSPRIPMPELRDAEREEAPLTLVRRLWRRVSNGGRALASARTDRARSRHRVFHPERRCADLFNCQVLAQLQSLLDLARPLMVGVSRKSFIGRITGRADPAERLWARLGRPRWRYTMVRRSSGPMTLHRRADVVRVAEAIRARRA